MKVLLRRISTNSLDKLVRPEIHILRRSLSAFHVCGVTGLALFTLLAVTLVTRLGLSPWIMGGIVAAAVLTFLGLVMTTKIITGEENIIYYHHEIAVMIVAALLLWLLGQPILSYLDVTILGIGVFLFCGRVGCLMVGCCHGRPHRWGVCYRKEHADAGFTPYYIGVRLFPIQAVELLWVFCVVLVGSVFVLNGYPPGTTLAWYFVAYGAGRFCFEFMRGDSERPYYWGFSQPQWLSLLLMCLAVWAELSGAFPFQLWHVGATAGLVVTMNAVALRRRFGKTAKHQLLHPHHVKEVAEALELVSNPATERTSPYGWTVFPRKNSILADIDVGCTSLGVQISASKIRNAAGWISHYALSYQDGGMTEETASVLVRLILQLKHATGSSEFLKGNGDVFHLLIH